jgi:hypothetical protein|nr:MAG TPA: hypothetical protein [Caudoviricetes sp.]
MGKFKNPLIKHKLRESETRRIAREEYDRICRKWTERFNLVSNTIALYTLHTAFGFGKDRLTRFLSACQSIQAQMSERYEDADFYAMKKALLDIGIDTEKIVGEMMADENSAWTGVDTN